MCRQILKLSVGCLATLSCACSSNATVTAAQSANPTGVAQWILVADPTVEQSRSVDDVFGALKTRVFANDQLTVFFVRDRSIAEPEISTKTYELNQKSKQWRREHMNVLSADVDRLQKRFHDLQTEFTSSGTRSRARSCILTSLSEVSRYMKKSRLARATYLIVVSDFLEVCPEESGTNLEKDLLRTDTLLRQPPMFSLGDVRKAAFLRVPSTHVATTTAQTHLERLWTAAAVSLGLSGDRFWFGEQVPQLGEYFGTKSGE